MSENLKKNKINFVIYTFFELNVACDKSGFKFSEEFNTPNYRSSLENIFELHDEKMLDESI